MNNLVPGCRRSNADEAHKTPCPVPTCFRKVVEIPGSSLDRKLGYFGNAQFVVFSFHPTAGEVIWNDGRSSGFGAGGWQNFLSECVRRRRVVPIWAHKMTLGRTFCCWIVQEEKRML